MVKKAKKKHKARHAKHAARHKPHKRHVARHKPKKEKATKIMLGVIVVIIILASLAFYTVNYFNNRNVVATVNGKDIMLSELDKRYNQIPQQYQELTSKQIILSQMIDEELLMQEAKKIGIKATQQEVDEAVQKAIQSTGLTPELFQEQLEENDLTTKDMQEYYEKQIIIYEKLPEELFTEQIQITEADIKSFYEANKELFVDSSGNQLSFEESEQIIELYLIGEQQKEMFQELLTRLRGEADIKIYDLNRISGKAVAGECKFEKDIIFYYADWCSLCTQMKPLAEKYAIEMIEESQSKKIEDCYPANMEMRLPQLICTENGNTLIGIKNAEEIQEFISEC
jgi:hypothetical protein